MRAAAVAAVCVSLFAMPAVVAAHDGPPYPIVSDRAAGPYVVSIWTDPDTTDDGSRGGQFWVRVDASRGEVLPEETRASVTVRPLGRPGPALTAAAEPVRGNVTNQFAALLLDHEGRFAVRVTIGGPLGSETIESEVDATYDLRPPPFLLVLYVLPFLAVGVLWGRLVASRRASVRLTRRS